MDASTLGWYTPVTILGPWPEAEYLDEDLLADLVEIAIEQVLAYAPSVDADTVPVRYRQAQLMQARNVYNAAKTDPAQSSDPDFFVLRPYPLDNHIKQLLRPRRGVPVIA